MKSNFRNSAAAVVVTVIAVIAESACGGGGSSAGSGSGVGSGGGSGSSGTSSGSLTVTMSASPVAITLGQSAAVTWSSTNATSCAGSAPLSTSLGFSGTVTVTRSASGTANYAVACFGSTSTVTVASATVAVSPAAPPAPAALLAMTATPASIALGQSAALTWSSTNATACTGTAGVSGTQALSGSTPITPATVGAHTYTLKCTGAGAPATASASVVVTQPSAPAVANIVPVTVDSGPLGTSVNQPFVSVTFCVPGTATCQTIDHILVDTGSFGLRVVASVVNAQMPLPAVANATGAPIAQCANFVSGSTWGAVRAADVKMAGEVASNIPIEIIGDAAAAYAAVLTGCRSQGTDIGSVAALAANGIIGVGLLAQNCGVYCAQSAAAGAGYFGCPSTGCVLTAVPIEKQVINPVAAFASDNNGMSLSFPAVAAAGANSLTGTLTFGVGTHADNQIDSAAVYTTNAALNVRSTFNNAQFSYSFIDSGSNGLFVPDSSIASYGGWFNPATQTPLSATILGYNSVSGVVGFDIVSIQSLTNGIHAASVGADTTLAGNVATDVKRPLSC